VISYTFNRLIMQAQHSLLLTSLLVLSAIVSTVQTLAPSPSSSDYRGSGRIENAYRGSGRVDMAYRGSGRVDMAYRGSGRVDMA
jgi:hypothetical protein